MSDWKHALTIVCERYAQSKSRIEWILVGSVGSVLQGCNMTPGDLDIYTRHREGIKEFAELLQPYALETKSVEPHGDRWLSSAVEPTFTQTFDSGFSWTKGRWNIDGFQVEAVHISNSAGIPDSLQGDGIWEGGQFIWSLYKNVNAGPCTVAVVPLEIQLESNLRRKRTDRIHSIMEALGQSGYSQELIEKALSKDHLQWFYSEIDGFKQ
ncbi:hypothetical protein DVH26_34505 [Paenibacillus sp. H1-7]|uniref:hypothetical protein n=1 Tax=Paenibacillus sp. H1-7 TaxID=2282849 RepID=UPI001EF8A8BF|nr:hypothetical protein [Paenibacillus sp. H1-7]ULL19098.1 hypothetical protein DVH26_34505 [Paenibacillus sp. H1-7]